MSETIPLYHFFSSLRTYEGFSLGLEEYYSLIDALRLQPDLLQNRERLLDLCCLLWLKPHQSKNLFVNLFHSAMEQFVQSGRTTKRDHSDNDFQNNREEKDEKNKSNKENTVPETTTEDKSATTTEADNPLKELYLNIVDKSGGNAQKMPQEEDILKPYKLRFIEHGNLLNQRQLNQKWKYYRHLSAGRPTKKINVAATVTAYAKNGFLLQPSFFHQQENLAEVIFLVDNSKSMIAFKPMVNALIHSSKINDIRTQVFYFYNLPKLEISTKRYIVFKNAAHTESQNFRHVLKKYTAQKRKIAIIMVSDAGAAKSDFDMEQMEQTHQFLNFLFPFTGKIAWLNPMPEDRWELSSASIIRDLVPMFEANEEGLQKAVNVLRGKLKGITNLDLDGI